jgi:hypothetical protein
MRELLLRAKLVERAAYCAPNCLIHLYLAVGKNLGVQNPEKSAPLPSKAASKELHGKKKEQTLLWGRPNAKFRATKKSFS